MDLELAVFNFYFHKDSDLAFHFFFPFSFRKIMTFITGRKNNYAHRNKRERKKVFIFFIYLFF